jgi:hypothetical protein
MRFAVRLLRLLSPWREAARCEKREAITRNLAELEDLQRTIDDLDDATINRLAAHVRGKRHKEAA